MFKLFRRRRRNSQRRSSKEEKQIQKNVTKPNADAPIVIVDPINDDHIQQQKQQENIKTKTKSKKKQKVLKDGASAVEIKVNLDCTVERQKETTEQQEQQQQHCRENADDGGVVVSGENSDNSRNEGADPLVQRRTNNIENDQDLLDQSPSNEKLAKRSKDKDKLKSSTLPATNRRSFFFRHFHHATQPLAESEQRYQQLDEDHPEFINETPGTDLKPKTSEGTLFGTKRDTKPTLPPSSSLSSSSASLKRFNPIERGREFFNDILMAKGRHRNRNQHHQKNQNLSSPKSNQELKKDYDLVKKNNDDQLTDQQQQRHTYQITEESKNTPKQQNADGAAAAVDPTTNVGVSDLSSSECADSSVKNNSISAQALAENKRIENVATIDESSDHNQTVDDRASIQIDRENASQENAEKIVAFDSKSENNKDQKQLECDRVTASSNVGDLANPSELTECDRDRVIDDSNNINNVGDMGQSQAKNEPSEPVQKSRSSSPSVIKEFRESHVFENQQHQQQQLSSSTAELIVPKIVVEDFGNVIDSESNTTPGNPPSPSETTEKGDIFYDTESNQNASSEPKINQDHLLKVPSEEHKQDDDDEEDEEEDHKAENSLYSNLSNTDSGIATATGSQSDAVPKILLIESCDLINDRSKERFRDGSSTDCDENLPHCDDFDYYKDLPTVVDIDDVQVVSGDDNHYTGVLLESISLPDVVVESESAQNTLKQSNSASGGVNINRTGDDGHENDDDDDEEVENIDNSVNVKMGNVHFIPIRFEKRRCVDDSVLMTKSANSGNSVYNGQSYNNEKRTLEITPEEDDGNKEGEKEVAEDQAEKVAAQEKASKEKERAAKELAAKELAAKELAAKEQAAKEQAAREQAAREQAAKELAAKEQAAKEEAARAIAAAEERHKKELVDQETHFNAQLDDAQKNIFDLESKVTQLQIKVQDLERELSAKTWNVERLEGELSAAHKEDEFVRMKLKLLEDEKTTLRQKSFETEEDLQRKYDDLDRQYKELNERYKEMKSLAGNLQTQLACAQTEAEECRKETETVRQEKDEQIRKLEEALAAAHEEKQELQTKWHKEFETLRTQNADREESLMTDCEWQLRQMQKTCKEKIDKAEHQRKEAIEKNQRIEQEAEEKLRQVEHLRSCEAEANQLRGLTGEQENSINSMRKQIDELKADLVTANENLEEQIECVRKIKYQCDNALYDKEREMLQKIDDVRNEAASLWENKLYTEMTRLKMELESVYVEERREELDKLQAEHIEELKALTTRYTANEEELRAEIAELKESLQRRNREYKELRDKSDSAILQTRMHLDRADRDYQAAMCREEEKREQLAESLRKELETEKLEMEEKFRERLGQVQAEFNKELQSSTQELQDKHKTEMEQQWQKLIAEKEEAIHELEARHRKKLQDAEDRLLDAENRHQHNLKDLKSMYDSEKAVLDKRDLNNANEIDQLHRKCRCLTNLFEEMRMRYERRDPRQEDLREIAELRSRCEAQERDIFTLTDKLREMQMQLEELQNAGSGKKKHQVRKPPPKTIPTNCDVIYEENEERESPPPPPPRPMTSPNNHLEADNEDDEEEEDDDEDDEEEVSESSSFQKNTINDDDTPLSVMVNKTAKPVNLLSQSIV